MDDFAELNAEISARIDRAWASIPEGPVPLRQWLKDQALAASTISDKEARFLVDDYYIIQEKRKRVANQERALKADGEPANTIAWFAEQDQKLETWMKAQLGNYAASHKMGAWLADVLGIGPVIAAGLLAYIDINKAPTVGHIWQFFGIAGAGQKPWQKKTKRPWSAACKVLQYKIGDSFIKLSNNPNCIYGHIYRERKAYEIANNDAGKLVEQALKEAEKKAGAQAKRRTEDKERLSDRDNESKAAWSWNAGCFPAGTCAAVMETEQGKREAYLKTVRGAPGSGLPMLHPGHINDRARRYAVKQFLADFHGEWYRREFGCKPPLPYPIAHQGHAHIR